MSDKKNRDISALGDDSTESVYPSTTTPTEEMEADPRANDPDNGARGWLAGKKKDATPKSERSPLPVAQRWRDVNRIAFDDSSSSDDDDRSLGDESAFPARDDEDDARTIVTKGIGTSIGETDTTRRLSASRARKIPEGMAEEEMEEVIDRRWSAPISCVTRTMEKLTSSNEEETVRDPPIDGGTKDEPADESASDYSSTTMSMLNDSSTDRFLLPWGSRNNPAIGVRDDAYAPVDSAEQRKKKAPSPEKKKKRNVESTRLADDPASFGEPSFEPSLEKGGKEEEEKSSPKTDTFEELYIRNVDVAQRYVERMAREQNSGCFSRSRKTISSLMRCRSPDKKNDPTSCDECASAIPRSDSTQERSSPILKVSLQTLQRDNKCLQISRRRPGNAFTLAGRTGSIDTTIVWRAARQ